MHSKGPIPVLVLAEVFFFSLALLSMPFFNTFFLHLTHFDPNLTQKLPLLSLESKKFRLRALGLAPKIDST